ncbi:MAG TPA: PHP domain-containing protein [Anaerolineaceae bacterium]|nr:PHP domain-containing protein [Anaerolineaceae bacterium]
MKTLKVDFHVHTRWSRDSLNQLPQLLQVAARRGLDRIVVTDHNTIAGALAARELEPERVIIGEEVKTSRGELLAAFVTEEVPKNLPPLEAITRLRSQGAFISVSHPFDRQRSGWDLTDLMEIAPLVDAIEIFNARCYTAQQNLQAQQFAITHNLPGTAGSDAHVPFEVGRALLVLPAFDDATSLRAVLPQARLSARRSLPLVHLLSFYARMTHKSRIG